MGLDILKESLTRTGSVCRMDSCVSREHLVTIATIDPGFIEHDQIRIL